jgi:hypothetical protein
MIRLFMVFFILIGVVSLFSALRPTGTIILASTFENISVELPLLNPSPEELRLLDSSVLEYRVAGLSSWRKGHSLSIIANIPMNALYELYADSIDMFSAVGVLPEYRLAGSILNVRPGTSYDVRVRLFSDEVISDYITGIVTTRQDYFPASGRNFYVSAVTGSDTNTGLAKSAAKRSISAIVAGGLLPGDRVHVANGHYYGGLLLDNLNGTNDNYIHFLAEGDDVVIEGSDSAIANSHALWTHEGNDVHGSSYYSIPVSWIVRGVFVETSKYPNSQGVLYRYHHDNITSGGQTLGDMINDITNLNSSGSFFHDTLSKKLYVLLANGLHPDSATIHVGRSDAAIDLRRSRHLLFHGFTIRHGNEMGLAVRNCRNVIIRSCKFEDSQSGIFMPVCDDGSLSYDCLIDSCQFSYSNPEKWMRLASDPWAAWQWQKMDLFESNGCDISQAGSGFVVRYNRFTSLFNAFTMVQYMPNQQRYFDPSFYSNIDVYGNSFDRVFDDAIEVEGSCVNLRICQNSIKRTHMGFSDAVTTVGPVYFIRNTISYWSYYMSGGNAIKAKPLWMTLNDFAPTYHYHNTFYIGDTSRNEWTFNCWNDFFDTYKNNIFVGGSGVWNMDKLIRENGAPLNLLIDYNSYYTTSSTGKFLNYRNSLPACNTALSVQAYGFESNGLFAVPGQYPNFTEMHLTAFSAELDKGVLILGINDSFAGLAPDIGAFEAFDLIGTEIASLKSEVSGILAAPNPFNPETKIFLRGDARNLEGKIVLAMTDVSGRIVKNMDISVSKRGRYILLDGKHNNGKPLPSGVYIVSVSSGANRFSTRIVLAR